MEHVPQRTSRRTTPHGLRVVVWQHGVLLSDIVHWRRRGGVTAAPGVPTPQGLPLCVVRWQGAARALLLPGFDGAPKGLLRPDEHRHWKGPNGVRVELELVARARAPRPSLVAGGDVVFITLLVSLLVLMGQLRILGDFWFPELQTSLDAPPSLVGGWTRGGGLRWAPVPPALVAQAEQPIVRVLPPVLAHLRRHDVTIRGPSKPRLKVPEGSRYNANAPVPPRTGVSPEVSHQQNMSAHSHRWLADPQPRFAWLLPPVIRAWFGCVPPAGDTLLQSARRLLRALGDPWRAACPGK